MSNSENNNKNGRAGARKYLPAAAVILAVILAVCLVRMIMITKAYRESEQIYDQTNEDYVVSADAAADETIPWYQLVSVDMESLRAENPEITGWIYFENDPEISYPVLHADNNKKYLRTAWQGEQAAAGSIFMECSNNPDFTDPHTIIYGHNMRNLSMFGRLRYYREQDYYPGHEFFQIITDSMVYRYQIVACKNVSAGSRLYTVWMSGGEEFRQFTEEAILADSMISTGYAAGPEDRIITLSTCNSTSGKRFVVSAVRIDQHERTTG